MTGSNLIPRLGHVGSRSTIRWFQPFVLIANRRAACWPMSTKKRARSRSSRAIPCIRLAVDGFVPKGRPLSIRFTIPDRVLYPMKRSGARGAGKWTRTSWDEVLETFGTRIRKAIQEGRGEEVMYHVGRPGHDFIMDRTLQAWGIDGHNSHTNVCSSSARLGYMLWHYADRPSPDHANARFILLLSAHLESGHYFNPHAQRIIDGKMAGAKLAVMDPRLSNTASMADYWMPTYPGTEVAVLLAMVKVILDENRFDAAVREELDQLGRIGSRWLPGERSNLRGAHRSVEETLRAVHPAVCGERKRRQGDGHRQDCTRDRDCRKPVRVASLARQRVRKSWWMAICPRLDAAARAHRIGGNRGWTQSELRGISSSRRHSKFRRRRRAGTNCSIRGSGRCPCTRCRFCCRIF